ncbi:hypothetical protein CKO51_28385 [Rhodopirellula sp. SM50]|nr:hypothetical protein CKO51_28385 [Rhodopirellula sp. SM50]
MGTLDDSTKQLGDPDFVQPVKEVLGAVGTGIGVGVQALAALGPGVAATGSRLKARHQRLLNSFFRARAIRVSGGWADVGQ